MSCLECPSIHYLDLEHRLEAMASHIDTMDARYARQAEAIEALQAVLMDGALDRSTSDSRRRGNASGRAQRLVQSAHCIFVPGGRGFAVLNPD